MTRSRWSALLLLVATFVVGVLVGAGGAALAQQRGLGTHGHASGPDGYADWLAHELALSPPQRDSVRAVLHRYQPAMDSLWRETRPRFETLRSAVRSDIRSHLTPEQRRKYEEMLERRRKAEPHAQNR